jgi:hypothetical protein
MSRSMFDNLEDFHTRALPESNQVKTLDQEKLIGIENSEKVEKAQKGYKVKNKTYEAEVKAPGDTVRTKKYPYSTQTMTTYPNGNVRYDKDLGEESLHW